LLFRLYSPSWTPGSLQRSPSALPIIRPDEGLWNPCMYRRNVKEKHFEFSEYVTVTQGKARSVVARRVILNTVTVFRRISVRSFRNYRKSNIWLAVSCKSVSAGSRAVCPLFLGSFLFVNLLSGPRIYRNGRNIGCNPQVPPQTNFAITCSLRILKRV
jgi:hypothetical protein